MTSPPADEIPLFPAPAPAELADPLLVRPLVGTVLTDLARVLATVQPTDLTRSTPCAGYDLAALRDHVLGWLDFFGAAFADPARTGARPDPEAYRAGDDPDPAATVARAAQRIDAALAAGVLDGDVVLSQARMHGPAALGMVLGEYVVHGWDLATTLGQPWQPPAAAVQLSHEFFGGIVSDEYRGGEAGFFDHEVPVGPDATALDKLIGFAGRNPAVGT